MKRYKVLKFFRWGDLVLNKNQIIIENKNNNTSIIKVEHIPCKPQIVSNKAIESMILLKKIENY